MVHFNMNFLTTLAVLVLQLSTTNAQLQCSKNDVNFVRSSLHKPAYFCDFYISHFRNRSPFNELPIERTMKACECLAGRKRAVVQTKGKVCPALVQPAVCNADNVAVLKQHMKYPVQFCRMFLPWASCQNRQPIQALPNAAVRDACLCIVNKSTTTSSKATTPATTPAVTTPAPTPEVAFCSQTKALKLVADPAASQFCWDVLDIQTPTFTSTIDITPTTTATVTQTPVTTSVVYVNVFSTQMVYLTSTTTLSGYTSTCNSAAPAKRSVHAKRAIPASVPAYLTTDTPAVFTSLCDSCMTDLDVPPLVTSMTTITRDTLTVTQTITAPTNTVTTVQTTAAGTTTSFVPQTSTTVTELLYLGATTKLQIGIAPSSTSRHVLSTTQTVNIYPSALPGAVNARETCQCVDDRLQCSQAGFAIDVSCKTNIVGACIDACVYMNHVNGDTYCRAMDIRQPQYDSTGTYVPNSGTCKVSSDMTMRIGGDCLAWTPTLGATWAVLGSNTVNSG